MSRATILLLVALLLPAAADARPKPQPVPKFYAEASQTLATVEFLQEFVAGGQRQQTRGFTDGAVISADGLVLISGRVRFPQRGGSGRISGGSLPELSGFVLHFSDGREHQADVVAFDDDLNLGLLRISDPPGAPMPHLKWRTGFEVDVGTGLRTLTLYTESFDRKPVYSTVMVNALLDKPQKVWSLSGASSNLLGAPLWDEKGRAVGVVAEVPMSPWAGRQVVPDLTGPVGLSYERFAVWIAQTLEAEAAVAKDEPDDADAAWLGVVFQPVSRELAEHLKLSAGGGVVVSRVVNGSPAAAAGLESLDVLVELSGERIEVDEDADTAGFAQAIRQLKPGTSVEFTREAPGGARDTVAVTLVQAPRTELHAQRRTNEAFALTVREATMDTLLGQRLDPDTTGVVVDGAERAGWAGLSGLGVGVIIQRINDHEVTDLDSFSKAMAAIEAERPEKVLFFARFGRNTRFFVAEPDWEDGAP